MKMNVRYFVGEVGDDGSSGYRAGSESGYATARQAFAVAERLAKSTGKTHVVDSYFVGEDGERDHDETLGYEHPQEAAAQ